jgi:hypothetical protein
MDRKRGRVVRDSVWGEGVRQVEKCALMSTNNIMICTRILKQQYNTRFYYRDCNAAPCAGDPLFSSTKSASSILKAHNAAQEGWRAANLCRRYCNSPGGSDAVGLVKKHTLVLS